MFTMPSISRHRAASGLVGAVAIAAAAAVALPAAAGTNPDTASGSLGSVRVASATTTAPTSTSSTVSTTVASRSSSSSSTKPSTPRPHCTGCVEHQVFGFEDGTMQNWQPYGFAEAKVIDTVGSTSPFLAHTGSTMLAVTGLGNAAGLRWPATQDTVVSGFQVRVWVRAHSRSGTLVLSVSGGRKYVQTSVRVEPGVWTPIVTPLTWMGGQGTPVVSLSQTDYCEDGNIGAVDIDDTAVAATFDPEPEVWQADNSTLLNGALPQLTLSMVPCKTTTTPSTKPTVIDFENRRSDGWQGLGMTATKIAKAAALDGTYGLRLVGLQKTSVGAKFTTDLKAFGGSTGTWYRLRMSVAGKPTVKVPGKCGPTAVPATMSIAANDALDETYGTFKVASTGARIEYWFRPAENATAVTFTITSPLQSLSVDTVMLDRASSPGSATTTPTTSVPTDTPPATSTTVKCKTHGRS